MQAFLFQCGKEAFHHRVVPAVRFAAHAARMLCSRSRVLKRLAGILAAAIAVMQQRPGRQFGTPSSQRHPQRIHALGSPACDGSSTSRPPFANAHRARPPGKASLPDVQMQVMSASQTRSGASCTNSRFSTFSATGSMCRRVGRAPCTSSLFGRPAVLAASDWLPCSHCKSSHAPPTPCWTRGLP